MLRFNIKCFIISLISLLLTFQAMAQKKGEKNEYLKVLELFYRNLLSNTPVSVQDCKTLIGYEGVDEMEQYLFYKGCKTKHISEDSCGNLYVNYYNSINPISLYFLKIKEQTQALTHGYKIDEIIQIIYNSKLIEDLGKGVIYIKLQFNDSTNIYVGMDNYIDLPCTIGNIYLSDDYRAYTNKISPGDKIYLKLLSVINDTDGYCNIRAKQSAQSAIVGKIKKGEKFSYTPNGKSKWWFVRKEDISDVKGYLYFDRIVPPKEQ